MKLSIAMIVKNEEKNIERTLIPLKQLKNYANVEIVIVDTGSIDKTVEIAKQYTDKIYFEEWNNNFADMRNVSIKHCTGDWILILDADEVLYDIKELAKLIDGRILNDFNSAFIKIINFNKNVEYSIENGCISPMMRLFKNDGITYEGLVHEQPKYKEPIFDSTVRFVHYGYDNSDSKLMEYKFNRNLKLLLEELKKEPEKIYTNFQIATAYVMHNDFRESEKYIDIAYKLVKNEWGKYIYVLDKYCLILYKLGKYEILVEKSKEAINYCDDFLDFYFYLGTALNSLNKYEEASKAYEKYLDICSKENLTCNATLSITTKLYRNPLIYNLSTCYYKLEMYEKSLETMLSIKDKELIQSSALMMFRILVEGKLYNRFECINDFVDKYNYESILIYTERDVLLEELE
ncbi:MAG: glycosyltransferase family 2 protein, partial [Clostridium butyricum]|nr:glycosyltransferase family 2 protein [Clostridium butyricum]